MSLRLITAGESHGPGLTCIVEGLPAGLELDPDAINADMARRQLGHGRGGRMKIERDAAEVTSGVRHGRTLGGPIALLVAFLGGSLAGLVLTLRHGGAARAMAIPFAPFLALGALAAAL